jgi:hypothetical protein
MGFVELTGMDQKNSNVEGRLKKFQLTIGEKIAYIEIISLTNYICSVEFSGQEPIFITRIRDKNNKSYWVSIPQGNDELAAGIGRYIDEQLRSGK